MTPSIDRRLAFPFAPTEFSRLVPCAVQLRYDEAEIEGLPFDEAERCVAAALAWANAACGSDHG